MPKRKKIGQNNSDPLDTTTDQDTLTTNKKKHKCEPEIPHSNGNFDIDEEDSLVPDSVDDLPEEVAKWSESDYLEMFENISKQLPKMDISRFTRTFDKINWDKVKFNNFSPDDCKFMASFIIRKIRKHRTLTEMLSDAKVWALNPHKSLTTGRISHPDKPKKPMTPFLRFYMEKRAHYQEQNPELNSTELSKLMSSKFTLLSEKKKLKYRRRYDAEMEEYKVKIDQFRLEHPEVFKNTRTKSVPIGPARPRKPYDFYLASRIKKYNDEDKKAAREAIRATWNNLSENKRLKWIKKSIQDRQRYENELKQYKEEHPDYKVPRIISKLSRSDIDLVNKFDGRPEKPPTSGYILFSKAMMKELNQEDIPAKEKMVIIAQKWKELQPEERIKFNEKVQKIQAKYNIKFQAYINKLPSDEKERVLAEQKTKGNDKKSGKKIVRNKVVENAALMAYQMEEIIRLEKEQPSMGKGELMATINQRWQNFAEEEKEKYTKLAESIKDYLPGFIDVDGVADVPQKSHRDMIEVEFVEKSGIKRPARNGFSLFCSETISNYTNSPPKSRMKLIAEVWKNELTQNDRDQYVNRAKEINLIFSQMLRNYKENGKLPATEEGEKIISLCKANPHVIKEEDVDDNEASTSNAPTSSNKSLVHRFLYEESSNSD